MAVVVANKTNAVLPTVYAFKDQGLFAIACLAIAFLFTFIAIIVACAASTTLIEAWGIFILPAFFFFGAILGLRSNSQVVVDNASISRRAFGLTWKKINWGDITLIRVVPLFNPALRKMVRTITLLTTSHGQLGFMDQLEHIDGLIDVINIQVKRYGIEIQVHEKGQSHSAPQV